MDMTIGWFDIPALDIERASRFYGTIFDFKPEIVNWEQEFHVYLPGNAGMLLKSATYTPGQTGVNIYINAGSDLNLVLNKVEEAGGKVVRPKTPITATNAWATFIDSEGNLVGLFEAN
jgi:uncharacterized protein